MRRRKEGKVGGREVKKKRKVEDNMKIKLICVRFCCELCFLFFVM